MKFAAKNLAATCLTLCSRAVTSVSNKLSIALVASAAVLALWPPNAASTLGSRLAPAPIELVRSRPLPLIETTPEEPNIEVAARRGRHKPEPQPTEPPAPAPLKRSGPVRQDSAIAPPPPKTPVAPVETKPDTAQSEPPKPDVWTDAEVITALRDCIKVLGPISAEVEVAPPVKHEQCGAPAPVMLRRIGSGVNRVEISPPAMINCAMVGALHVWVERTLQPAAQEMLGAPVTRLRNASGYICRTRNGTSQHADRLSEHAFANAIDIAGFVTADGRTVDVVRHWGPTARDRREAARVAAAASSKDTKARKDVPDEAPAKSTGPERTASAIAVKAVGRLSNRGKRERPVADEAELQQLGRREPVAKGEVPAPKTRDANDNGSKDEVSVETSFLRQLHKGACSVFGTVLGPEANEAHRNHFHFDLAQRRRSAFCE